MRASKHDAKTTIRAMLERQGPSTPGPIEARRIALLARQLARDIGDPLLEAEAVLQIGRHRLAMVHPEQALALLEHAAQIFVSNRRFDRVGACEALRARALLDLGRDVQAVRVAEAVLSDPVVGLRDQVHADLVRILALGRLGRFDEAISLAEQHAVPRARAVGEPYLIAHAICVHAVSRIFDLFARSLPTVWHGSLPGLEQRLTLPTASSEKIERLLDEATSALPPGDQWRFIDGLKLFFAGLTGERSVAQDAVSRLGTLALLQIEQDPPQAAWLFTYRGYIEHRLDSAEAAALSMIQAAALGERWGLVCQVREAHHHLAHLYESMKDNSRALRSHKTFANLHLRSVLETEFPVLQAAFEPLVAASRVAKGTDQNAVVPEKGSQAPSRTAPVHVSRALRRIDEWSHGKLLVGEVVQSSGVSRRTLELATKDFCNATVSELIRRRGMDRAAQQLRNTSASIVDVAAAAGYNSTAAFGAAFRAQFGLSPTLWRRDRHSAR